MFDYSRKPVKWQVGNFSYLRSFDLEYSNLYDVICKYRKKRYLQVQKQNR